MGFSKKQTQALGRSPNARFIKTRSAGDRELPYIEGWHAIEEANRIFGFDGWNRETFEAKCLFARKQQRGSFLAIYSARVRITVLAAGLTITRDGHGTGEARGASLGEVHDTALKAAETDATKRALSTFGRSFGLAIHINSSSKPRQPKVVGLASGANSTADSPPVSAAPHEMSSKVKVSAVVSEIEPVMEKIDKSALRFGRPRRYRAREHLRFVAAQPCLICGRQPSDAHHLKFAQPTALSMKVSDEFTVPLCRIHHRQLHWSGNEVAWWNDLDVDALEIAKGLWAESRSLPKTA